MANVSRSDLEKELAKNHKTYLENQFIYDTLREIVLESDDSKNCNAFWKSFILGNLSTIDPNNQKSIELSKFESNEVSRDLKESLLAKLKEKFEQNINSIQEFMQNYDNPATILTQIQEKIDKITHLKEEIQELDESFQLKLKNIFVISNELINLLTKILKEFKIDFYSKQDLIKCEHIIIESEAYLAKFESLVFEYTSDTYSNDKLKALAMIKQQIDSSKQRADYDFVQFSNSLEGYGCLGKEFQVLLKEYVDLKEILENKKWTLNEIKTKFMY